MGLFLQIWLRNYLEKGFSPPAMLYMPLGGARMPATTERKSYEGTKELDGFWLHFEQGLKWFPNPI